MKLREAAFLTDENLHSDVVAYLRNEGHDVLDVRESGLGGSADVALIRKSVAESRVILTHDNDFGNLAIAAQEPIYGIVYLRPGHIRGEFTIETLRSVLDQELDIETPFLLVAKRSANNVNIRIRTL